MPSNESPKTRRSVSNRSAGQALVVAGPQSEEAEPVLGAFGDPRQVGPVQTDSRARVCCVELAQTWSSPMPCDVRSLAPTR